MGENFKIAVIGSGPSGLSAATRAAELGVSHVLLEAETHYADTIFKYQRGKHVMAEPAALPLRSPLGFSAGTRERILALWDEQATGYKVNIRYRSTVEKIDGAQGNFQIHLAGGAVINAEFVVLAIGLQGNLRRVGVSGDELDQVQYQLADPGEFEDETIVVVGAGDAAIENALALAEQNRVIMLNRNDEFARCKEANLALVMEAIEDGRIECRFGTKPERIELADSQVVGVPPLRLHAVAPRGAELIQCHRIIARLGATPPRKLVESFGVRFPNAEAGAVPELNERYESNVPGLHIIGALGGYPLIKQAMNQGYEVVEHILGRTVEPADEPLLKAKFAHYPRATSVAVGIELIRTAIPLFAGLTVLQLREFLIDSDIHQPVAGATIFARADYTNTFFSILEGEAIVHTEGKGGAEVLVPLGKGSFFGEMGLISGRRRSATVTAGKNCVIIETPRRSMLRLLASSESVQRKLDEVSLKRVVRSYLASSISDSDLDVLVEGASFRRYGAGAVLFEEGAVADGLYLIRRGSVTVSRRFGEKEVVLSYVAAGNFVGEMALMSNVPRSATVRAAVETEVIMLEARQVTEVMARNTSMRGMVDSRYSDRLRANEALAARGAGAGSLISFLMSQGLGEATDVLLIDESLCIRCDNCEKACSDTHEGTSRLDREAGPTYAQIHVPTSCRHCEHPHCMKDCPPDAIRRSSNGEVLIADTCIGCGNCERNCPYGVIQMAPVAKPKSAGFLNRLFFGGTGSDAEDNHAKKAVKCDMCNTLPAGPACVRACPTGAAIRVSPEKFLSFTDAPL